MTFIDVSANMNMAEMARLEQLRRDDAERKRLEEKARIAAEAQQAKRDKQKRNADRRKAWVEACERIEASRIATNRKMLPDIRDIEAYRSLPVSLKSKYMTAFGPEFLENLEARSKAGMSQEDWDRLLRAEPIQKGSELPPEPTYE